MKGCLVINPSYANREPKLGLASAVQYKKSQSLLVWLLVWILGLGSETEFLTGEADRSGTVSQAWILT